MASNNGIDEGKITENIGAHDIKRDGTTDDAQNSFHSNAATSASVPPNIISDAISCTANDTTSESSAPPDAELLSINPDNVSTNMDQDVKSSSPPRDLRDSFERRNTTPVEISMVC